MAKWSTGKKIAVTVIVGGVAIGGGLLIRNQLRKNALKAPPMMPSDIIPSFDPVSVIQTASSLLPGSGISPSGTPGSAQDWDKVIRYGHRGGEVETAQKLFNRISKIRGYGSIVVDGDWGPKTEAKKKQLFGTSTVTLAKIYRTLQQLEGGGSGSSSGAQTAMTVATSDPFYKALQWINPFQ